MTTRRFPPPRAAEETDACFIVRDANGQALAYVYFEEELGRRSAAKLLTRGRGPAHRRQHRQAAGVVDCPRNLIQPAELCWVSGQEATPPIPAPKFPVPRSPAALRRAGLSLAADPQQGA